MFLQKFEILINKLARPITKFNDEVTKLPSGDDITRFDGTKKLHRFKKCARTVKCTVRKK
jgi:hypothetical protein